MKLQKKIVLFIISLVFLTMTLLSPHIFTNERVGSFLSGFFMGLSITILVYLIFSKNPKIENTH